VKGDSRPIAFVTGGAGSIGRATVRALVSRLSVVAADRNPVPGAERSLLADAVTLDLKDDGAMGRVASGVRALGQLKHVIAIAGGGDADEVAQTDPTTEDPETFSRVLNENLLTAFITVRNLVPLLREAKETAPSRS
jgi:NAD(P)-dependent dehydrogenase (short-subunit alcohol dehydrogenase family)